MSHKGPRNPERSFGLSVGAVLCAIALALVWRGRAERAAIVGGTGVFLVAAGAIYPRVLKYPSAAWWRFAQALGWVNARVLLSILFFIVLTPLSLLWRITGKDPLARNRHSWPGWTPYPARYRDKKHYDRMY